MYFMMEEDKRIQNRIRFKDIESNVAYEFEDDELPQIQDISVLFMEGNKDSIYPDVIETPVFLVSDRLKRLLEPYDPAVFYRRVALNQVKEKKQRMYWLLITEKTECLDERSEYYPNGWNKRVILERGAVGARRIFKVKGLMTPKILVHVDVAESIMRRDFDGILFRPVEVRQEEVGWLI